MKVILVGDSMDLLEGFKVKIKARRLRVSGPRRMLTRNLKHLNNTRIEIRNFLEEKKGEAASRRDRIKDEVLLECNNIELLPQSCALINQEKWCGLCAAVSQLLS
ncbi:large ribosomal subunit protein uL6x [Physcomitrium patens]|uniref:Uncharacterized protein n=1 Tax=Physcomitrium patens TaxID=3218 RepID=A9T8H9_PHYPA|nr:60S ribosomal protein L9-2-like [Physcomitrium patens]PNR59759.1 hypothetical protein PHYPA_002551 [Physcomitrium patens]|eukprot:XP_024362686.1 60S ribosomal protein L9-2-like [Physcomitrella patens]